MTYLDFEKRLFVALLKLQEEGETESVDLQNVCSQNGLPKNENWLVKFLNENNKFGSGNGFTDIVYFSLNREGRIHAEAIRAEVQSKTMKGRLASITRSDWIAFGALVVSVLGVVFD